MLPLLLKGNEKVSVERSNLTIFFKKGNFNKLKIFCKKYKIKTIDCNNLNSLNNDKLKTLQNILLNRVNVLPISMMLAQAIVESGWGGSRFAQKGNALFGQWTWDKKKGISPTGIYKPSFAVKSFKNLQDSVDAYILNLNTHPAYEKLRNYRKLISNPPNFEGHKFSRYLDKYAIIGFEYVKKINLMIKKNNLEKFNLLRFKVEN
jgi:Bax protein